MKIKEIISAINLMREFVDKGYELPFKLRRAIRLNDEILMKEYLGFIKERDSLKEKGLNEEDFSKQINEILDTEVDIKIEKVSYDIMETVTIPIQDENMIMFMLEM